MFRFSDRENYAGLQLLKLICFDFQGGKFKLYLIPGSSVFTFDLRKLAHQISNVTERETISDDDEDEKTFLMLRG